MAGPKFRINQTSKGFTVEIRSRKWYGNGYWKPLITPRGVEDEPWYYGSIDSAWNYLEHWIRENTEVDLLNF